MQDKQQPKLLGIIIVVILIYIFMVRPLRADDSSDVIQASSSSNPSQLYKSDRLSRDDTLLLLSFSVFSFLSGILAIKEPKTKRQ